MMAWGSEEPRPLPKRPREGSDAVGPYRKNFQEALRELQELRALQQLRGDKVLCQVSWAQIGGAWRWDTYTLRQF